MSVGNKIRTLREERRMSQDELAKAVGYKTRSSIAKIESGDSDPSQKMLFAIAYALDVSPAELIDDSDYSRHPIVSTDPWEPDDMAAEKDDNIRIMGRGYKRLSPENRALLLQIAKKMFAEDFDEEGNKKT